MDNAQMKAQAQRQIAAGAKLAGANMLAWLLTTMAGFTILPYVFWACALGTVIIMFIWFSRYVHLKCLDYFDEITAENLMWTMMLMNSGVSND